MCDLLSDLVKLQEKLGAAKSKMVKTEILPFWFKSFNLSRIFRCSVALGLLLLTFTGCANYKDDLDKAKQIIDNQTNEIKMLNDQIARCEADKKAAESNLKSVSEKNVLLRQDLENLNKTKDAMSSENREIRGKLKEANDHIVTLKQEIAQLSEKADKLQTRLSDISSPPKTTEASRAETEMQSIKPQSQSNPCDEVIFFMKASEEVIRQLKGKERSQSLQQIKEKYAPRMKGAPDRAIRAAEEWVRAGVEIWDKPSDDSTYKLIKFKNIVLEACGKTAADLGIK